MSELDINETGQIISEQIIEVLVNAWASQNTTVTNFFTKHSDEVYLNEVAPGRNRGIYLLGHLIATSDGMIPLLGFGNKLFPDLGTKFSNSPDRVFDEIPTMEELRKDWETVNTFLTEKISKMQPNQWLERHTAVSEDDFAINPKRNKLNVLISRTIHMGYHLGQLKFLSKRL